MSFGPNPWQQAHWDWRAAGNFMFGGVGGGLLLLAMAMPPRLRSVLALVGLALVGAGLFCVWLEIGRPWRALHVMFHPQRSWMTREAFVAALLFPSALAVAAGVGSLAAVVAVLALAFVFCQGRIITGAKGIPAWREPMVWPLVMATGLTEGAGLMLILAPLLGARVPWLPLLLVLLMFLRLALWTIYRRRVAGRTAPPATRVLDQVGGVLQFGGSLLPLVLLAPLAVDLLPAPTSSMLGALAGASALAAGAWMKYCLITRAGYNQGFALARLPVRGVPR